MGFSISEKVTILELQLKTMWRDNHFCFYDETGARIMVFNLENGRTFLIWVEDGIDDNPHWCVKNTRSCIIYRCASLRKLAKVIIAYNSIQ